jgi:hypothetical protein
MFFNSSKQVDGTKHDRWYDIIDPRRENVPVEITFGWVNQTFEGIKKQIMLYDRPQPEKLPEETVWAEKQVIDMLHTFGVFSKLLPLVEIDFNMQSATGVGLRKDYKSKGDYFRYNKLDCEKYLEEGPDLKAIPLWSIAFKNEYLKLTKIKENNGRIFIIPPVNETAMQLSVLQFFNKQLYKHFEYSPIKVGINFADGGFHRLVKKLQGLIDIQGDCTKWDKTFCDELRLRCKNIRMHLYRGINREEFYKRLEFIYRNSTESYLVTPWGQVLEVRMMKSGDGGTTPDNCMAHLMVVFAYIKRNEKYILNVLNEKELTWRVILRFFELLLYSDDHVFGFPQQMKALSTFDIRSAFYREYGLQLKKDDDVVKYDGNPIGLTFLGAVIEKYYGWFVPLYSLNRIWSALVGTGSQLEPKQYFCKICSLAILATFHGRLHYNRITDIARQCIEYWNANMPTWYLSKDKHLSDVLARQGVDDFFTPTHKFPFIPTYEWAIQFWLGLETTEFAHPIDHGMKNIVIERAILFLED